MNSRFLIWIELILHFYLKIMFWSIWALVKSVTQKVVKNDAVNLMILWQALTHLHLGFQVEFSWPSGYFPITKIGSWVGRGSSARWKFHRPGKLIQLDKLEIKRTKLLRNLSAINMIVQNRILWWKYWNNTFVKCRQWVSISYRLWSR